VTNEGWNPAGPRKIVGLRSTYLLWAKRYKCGNKQCPRNYFTGSDPGVVDLLPHYVQALFPAVITERAGVDKEVAKLLLELVSTAGLNSFMKGTPDNFE